MHVPPAAMGPLALVQLVAETHMQALCQAVWLPEFIDLGFCPEKEADKDTAKVRFRMFFGASIWASIWSSISLLDFRIDFEAIDLGIDFRIDFGHRFYV